MLFIAPILEIDRRQREAILALLHLFQIAKRHERYSVAVGCTTAHSQHVGEVRNSLHG